MQETIVIKTGKSEKENEGERVIKRDCDTVNKIGSKDGFMMSAVLYCLIVIERFPLKSAM